MYCFTSELIKYSISNNKQSRWLRFGLKCACYWSIGFLFCYGSNTSALFIFLFLPQAWSIKSATPDHKQPTTGQVEPRYWPFPLPFPLINHRSEVVFLSSNLLCWSDNLTPLGLGRRPRGSPHWSSKLCLAMPQVRGVTGKMSVANMQDSSFTGRKDCFSSWLSSIKTKMFFRPWQRYIWYIVVYYIAIIFNIVFVVLCKCLLNSISFQKTIKLVNYVPQWTWSLHQLA